MAPSVDAERGGGGAQDAHEHQRRLAGGPARSAARSRWPTRRTRYDAKPFTTMCGTNPLPGMYEHVNGMRRQSAISHSTSSQPIAASTRMTLSADGPAPTIEPVRGSRAAARRRARARSGRSRRRPRHGRGRLRSSGRSSSSEGPAAPTSAMRMAGIARKIIVIGAQRSVPSNPPPPLMRVSSGSRHPSALSRPFSTKPPAAANTPTTRVWCSTLRRTVSETKRWTACRTGDRPIHRLSERTSPPAGREKERRGDDPIEPAIEHHVTRDRRDERRRRSRSRPAPPAWRSARRRPAIARARRTMPVACMAATTRRDAKALAVPGSRASERQREHEHADKDAPHRSRERRTAARAARAAPGARARQRSPGREEAADQAREREAGRNGQDRSGLHGSEHGERRKRQEREMRAGDEQPREEQQRRELRRRRSSAATAAPPSGRGSRSDPERASGRPGRGDGDDPHRHGHEERVIGDDLALVGVWLVQPRASRTSP